MISRLYVYLFRFIIEPLLLIYRQKEILWVTVYRDVKVSFAGLALGNLWLILTPIFMLGAYACVYIFIFKVKVEGLSSLEYVMFIFSGLVPYLGFSESLAIAIPSVVGTMALVKNVLFPIELVPVKAVLTAQVNQFIGLLLIFIGLCYLNKVSYLLPISIVLWLLQILFSVGLCWILSSLNVYLRDIQQVVPVILLTLMMLSPISYTENMVPKNLLYLLKLNPLYHMVICYQNVLIFGKMPPINSLITFIIMSNSLFFIGYFFFKKMKVLLSDYV